MNREESRVWVGQGAYVHRCKGPSRRSGPVSARNVRDFGGDKVERLECGGGRKGPGGGGVSGEGGVEKGKGGEEQGGEESVPWAGCSCATVANRGQHRSGPGECLGHERPGRNEGG